MNINLFVGTVIAGKKSWKFHSMFLVDSEECSIQASQSLIKNSDGDNDLQDTVNCDTVNCDIGRQQDTVNCDICPQQDTVNCEGNIIILARKRNACNN